MLLTRSVVTAALVGGCGGAARPGGPPSDRGPDPAAPMVAAGSYDVVAPVLYLRRAGRPLACLDVLESLPPAGCGGVAVKGYDFGHVAGVVRFGGMGWQTPPLRITGMWDGDALQVTGVARAATPSSGPSPPARCEHSTRAGIALGRAIARRPARIHLLELSPCRSKVWVLVAAADEATVSYLRDHFGRRVIVRGWLRPARQA